MHSLVPQPGDLGTVEASYRPAGMALRDTQRVSFGSLPFAIRQTFHVQEAFETTRRP